MKQCRDCSAELVVGTNWRPSRAKRYDNQCNACGRKGERERQPPYKRLAINSMKRATRRGAYIPNGITPSDFNNVAIDTVLFRKHGYDPHVDHIIPIAAGGCHCPSNVQMLPSVNHVQKSRAEKVWLWLHAEVFGKAAE